MSREPPLFVIALSRKNEDRCTIALVDTMRNSTQYLTLVKDMVVGEVGQLHPDPDPCAFLANAPHRMSFFRQCATLLWF